MGYSDDVQTHIDKADCVVLPSYREGAPKSLLEAAAMAKPIIASNVEGCREVVADQITGYLCRVKDANDLASKMIQIINLPNDIRRQMGVEARKKMAKEFDERIVIEKYLKASVVI